MHRIEENDIKIEITVLSGFEIVSHTQSRMPARKNVTVSSTDRGRLLKMAEEGGDFLNLADALGIPHSNARRIVSSRRIEKKKTGGAHNEKGTLAI